MVPPYHHLCIGSNFGILTVISAHTDGGRQILSNLSQGGQYITRRYPDIKNPVGPKGGGGFWGT